MIVKWGRTDRVILVTSSILLVVGVIICASAIVSMVIGLHQ